MITCMRDDRTVIALVERARDGDQGAWNEIVERYATLVWSLCRRYGLSGTDADDVGAAVWLRLVERLGTLREPAALPGWIATTTRRECLQRLKARNRQVVTDEIEGEAEGQTGDGPEDWLLVQERHIVLRAAFAELSERCRRLLSMLFDDPPMPYAEIGAELGLRIGAIGPTRMRCLDRLRNNPIVAALRDATPAGGR
jgi:RNA polymerase sigma factor (sigma-70 family)